MAEVMKYKRLGIVVILLLIVIKIECQGPATSPEPSTGRDDMPGDSLPSPPPPSHGGGVSYFIWIVVTVLVVAGVGVRSYYIFVRTPELMEMKTPDNTSPQVSPLSQSPDHLTIEMSELGRHDDVSRRTN
ncbi:hypothetical protein C5167_040008 [Papaver somniferum]|uniref:Transmembrane protein n=1 Tax=Papaver somniferum TaxID=3469 RepID=A0A4Y7IH74_PAPSO|nr:uncharacterized protein LOC113335481 [Papaver somniferum]RZC47061.1 hypothetical protein C5167_040008 [Papaver somniferum]